MAIDRGVEHVIKKRDGTIGERNTYPRSRNKNPHAASIEREESPWVPALPIRRYGGLPLTCVTAQCAQEARTR